MVNNIEEILKEYGQSNKKIIALYQERLKKLSEIIDLADFFFKDVLEYDKELLSREEIVVLSKIDMVSKDDVKEKLKALKKASGKSVELLSLYEDDTVKAFGDGLVKLLTK